MSGCNFKSSIGVWLHAVAAFGQAHNVGLGDVVTYALKCSIYNMYPACAVPALGGGCFPVGLLCSMHVVIVPCAQGFG